jgi:hypothetical protein
MLQLSMSSKYTASNGIVVNGFYVLFIYFCSLAASFIVTEKLYFEQETAGTATTEFAELQVQ